MLVIHSIWLTVGNHANWLEVHLLRLPCGRSNCSLSFFSQKLIFVNVISRESPVPSRGEVFPKRIYFFSGLRGSRVFLSSFLILGLIFQSGNLHLDPASTWHRLGIYISHKRLFFSHAYTRPQTQMPSKILDGSSRVSHRLLNFNFPKWNFPQKIYTFPQDSLFQ